jgi:hypothetical protein
VWLVWLVTRCTLQGQNWLTSYSSFLFSNPPESAAFVSSTTMAPQLDAAQHILIETLLKEGFKTKLIAQKPRAACALSRESVSRDSSSQCLTQEQTALAVVAVLHHLCKEPSVTN